ncbi:hypothetical protein V2A60_005882 [Cordyceps javanica]
MARRPARNLVIPSKALITWTRFYLPRNQEWPVWAGHEDIYSGPLLDLGIRSLRLRRMVDDPEQAAYIIEWNKPEVFGHFLASSACVVFLNDLPEFKDAAASVTEAGSYLHLLTLEDATVASGTPSLAKSRLLLCQHSTEAATRELDGLVTLTAFSVPGQFNVTESVYWELVNTLVLEFGEFMPLDWPRVRHRHDLQMKFSAIWLCVLEEDGCVTEKFGAPSSQQQAQPKLQQQEEQQQPQRSETGRAIFCHIFRWTECYDEPHEVEAIAAEDAEAKETWEQAAARLMPPATAWVQERWDIRDVPLFEPPELQEGPEWEEAH